MSNDVRPRPALLRALGCRQPPQRIAIDGRAYARIEVLKHDSWAATAVYQDAGGGRIVAKFHRQQPILGVPMQWLGRRLARRESLFLQLLAELGGIPKLLGPVDADGIRLEHALARQYIAGHPLGRREAVGDDFFPRLARLLAELHVRSIAYVDLHKRENVIVGDDGQPYLIDFQISLQMKSAVPVVGWLAGRLLRMLQATDDFHLGKLHARCRPDQVRAWRGDVQCAPPRWIRLHRLIAVPLRTLRRRLLVLLSVRSGEGMADSEHFAEDAFRSAA